MLVPSGNVRVFTSSQGTVDNTPTPGAAISTSLFRCEKLACASFESTALTETTDAYPAG